jgi:hypothetical protein
MCWLVSLNKTVVVLGMVLAGAGIAASQDVVLPRLPQRLRAWMPSPVELLVLAVLGIFWCLLGSAEASTMTMITTPVKNIVGAVKEIGYYIAPLLLVGVIVHYRHGATGMTTFVEVVVTIAIIGIVVYADDIITFIRPAAAAAHPLVPSLEAPLILWQAFGTQALGLASLTVVIRHLRRARQVP